MTYYVDDKKRNNNTKVVDIDGKPTLFIGTRDGTPQDDRAADMNLFGLGNREQSMLAISKMTDAELEQWKKDCEEKINNYVAYHRNVIDEQANILLAQYNTED